MLDVDLVRSRGLDPIDVTDAWLEAGVRLLQLRAKSRPLGPVTELADVLAARARAVGATFLVNDRADVARLSGADGVHVGQEDLTPAEVRALVGPDALVGLSTHSTAQVRAAREAPISYLAIGPVFPTTTKARPDPVVGVEGVSEAAAEAGQWPAPRPVVAIGGLTRATAAHVLRAGAASLAVASDLIGDDPAASARAWLHAVGEA
ncbi:MAG: thiamine phosphate synthase [Vicinamibacterales bacterium]